ncbi:hypothetical protein EJ08DRAFT_666944 [Tothia fuscella]|uniref:Spindle pole body component n=1 Tax=Tothia fuscella TaxID=1048955 RepID=A0A9P4P543_9PEZI|nr:hypothetical protein EJ08DRAFT_666944 [Tothia fuscella]
MAQTSTINALLGNLITSISGQHSKSPAREQKTIRDSALRTVKAQQYVRTNQFEVESSIDGLIEKFSILNRDDLSSALKARIEELAEASRSKWTPEILSLFLNLSDRPVEKTEVDALKLIRPPTPPEPPLTWEEIEADDPLTGDIWDEVSYSAGSSDEDIVVRRKPNSRRKGSSITQPGKQETQDDLVSPSLLVSPDPDILREIEQSQFWKSSPVLHTTSLSQSDSAFTHRVSELQTIREVLLMLRGLPTSLFGIDEEHSVIFYSADISLENITNSSLDDVLQRFANIGSDLYRLRAWVRKSKSTPLLQAFHASVASRLRSFDKELSNIERDVVAPSIPTTVSVMRIHDTIRNRSRPLLRLGGLVDRVPTHESGFSCLELLYDEICVLQASGDQESYELIARVFFECLKIYLRPVRKWIESGEVGDQDESFFVAVAAGDCAPSALWKDRFKLRMTANGELYAPKFLEPAGRKILNAGKSIVFLRQLSLQHKLPPTLIEPSLDFNDLPGNDSLLSLAPFAELFGSALDNWVKSKYGPASSILCQQLFSHCNLGGYLDALEHVCCSKDGILFQTFADELFQRMDDRQKVWNDRFLLTELARSVFGTLRGIDESRISVRTLQAKGAEQSVKALSGVAIDLNLPWPVLNIVQRTSLPTYQRILRLLLQIYRAKYLLRRDSIILRSSGSTDENTRSSNYFRQRLVWFVDIMFSYVLETVVQPTTSEMRTKLCEADDVDVMVEVHDSFISKLQTQCLFARNLAPIHDTIVSLLDLSVSFTDNQSRRLQRQTNKSRFASVDIRRPRRNHTRRKSQRQEDDISSEDNDEEDENGEGDDDYDADNETSSSRNESYDERLARIQEQFGQLLSFAVAGLKGVSRVGEEVAWEMLAERLEWGVSRAD